MGHSIEGKLEGVVDYALISACGSLTEYCHHPLPGRDARNRNTR